jgi:hypothetical protein
MTKFEPQKLLKEMRKLIEKAEINLIEIEKHKSEFSKPKYHSDIEDLNLELRCFFSRLKSLYGLYEKEKK